MLGESLIAAKRRVGEISVGATLQVWSWFYLVTERSTYEISAKGIFPALVPTEAVEILPPAFANQLIVEMRKCECDCVAVLLKNGSTIVFDMTFNPFLEGRSYPTLDFQTFEESQSWADEYQKMKKIDVISLKNDNCS